MGNLTMGNLAFMKLLAFGPANLNVDKLLKNFFRKKSG